MGEKEPNNGDLDDNYYNIISMSDRIKENKSKFDRVKNVFSKIILISLIYIVCSEYFGYENFLRANNNSASLQIYMLVNFISLAFLSFIWGSFYGSIGGLLGEFYFQTILNINYAIPLLLNTFLIGLFSGLYRYKKDILNSAKSIVIVFLEFAVSSLCSLFLMDSYLHELAISFSLSVFISVPIFTMILILVVDLLLKKNSNEFNVVYNVFFTHHEILARDHAIPVKVGEYNMFFCTRCSGTLIGVLIGLVIELSFQHIRGIALTPETALIVCIITPIPGLVDWGTQTLGYRKSNDVIRIITGIFLGIAIHMLSLTKTLVLEMFILLMVYFSIFFVIYSIPRRKLLKKLNAPYTGRTN